MEKTEELLKNWHLNEMTAGWKAERENQRDFTKRAIDKINADKEDKLKRMREYVEVTTKEINAEAETAILAEKHKLQECLIAIARREDEYMHKFRNYVASLPKDEQADFSR